MNKLKSIFAKLSLLAALMALSFSSFAGSPEGRTVRVGFFESTGMFEGAADGLEKRGYCYDYMMQIATYTGWHYEFCYGSFADLYEKLKKGEIDILPYTNYNERRGREVLFSDKALAVEEYYLAVKKDPSRSPGISSLDGAVISTMKDADYNSLLFDFIRKNGLDVTVNYYHYVDEIWDAMRGGEADATIYTSNSYSRDDWECICQFGSKPTYICVAKERPDLLEGLNEAIDLINKENPALQESLYARYFSGNPVRKKLTGEEKEWIEAHPVLHVGGFYNDAPDIFSYDETTHSATGLTVEVINGIIERLDLGIKADFRCYDTLDEMYAALDRGEIDVIYPYYPDHFVAQEHGLIISNTVRVSDMALVFKNGTPFSEAMEKVATPSTRLGQFFVHSNFPESEIVPAVSIPDAVQKVLEGKASGAVAQNVVLQYLSEKYDRLNDIILSQGCGTCFAARPANYPLMRVINRGLIYFTDTEISAITSQYTLDRNISLKTFLSAHKDMALILAIILASLLAMVAILLQINHLKIKADAANRSKSAFLFNMSHDIRTPMNAIAGFTEMAKKNSGDKARVEEYLDKIDSSGQQLLTLINQVLEMSRIESGKVEIELQPVNVKERFDAMSTVFGEQARMHGLEFRPSLVDIKHFNVLADDAKLSQIALNVAGNAIKYTPSGGYVDFILKEIPARKEGYGTYVFTVADNGIGMKKEYLKMLYEPFTREKNSTSSKIQGTGLGMSIVKNLVDLMDGDIAVQSEQGKGTQFDITVDFIIDDSAVEPAPAAPRQEEEHPLSLEGKKVLLVEDNELNREIARFILEERGLVVDEAVDGDIAVDLIRTLAEKGECDRYDFILMDVQMPRMNGYEATAAIRMILDPMGVHIPIIALSANAFEEDKAKSREAGMDDHVAKPIDIKQLLGALERFL